MLRFAPLTPEDLAIRPPWWLVIWYTERADAMVCQQIMRFRNEPRDKLWRARRAFVGLRPEDL